MLVFVTFGLDKVIKEELRFHLPILFLIVPWTMHTFTSFIERMNGILFGEGWEFSFFRIKLVSLVQITDFSQKNKSIPAHDPNFFKFSFP